MRSKRIVVLVMIAIVVTNLAGFQVSASSAGSINTNLFGNGRVAVNTAGFNDVEYNPAVDAMFATGGSTGGDVVITRIHNNLGSSGSSTAFLNFGGVDTANAMSVMGDGRIVVAGDRNPGDGNTDILVARLNPDLSLDTSFNGTGSVLTDVGGRPSVAFAAKVQTDNRIVIGGRLLGGASTDGFIARYNSNGTLDTSFGINGIVIIDDAGATNLVLDLVVTTTITASGLSGNDIAVYRLNANGSLDTTFSGDGKVSLPVAGGSARANAMVIWGTSIIVAGSAAGGNQTVIARLLSNGAVDSTFGGGDGMTVLDLLPNANEGIADLEISTIGLEIIFLGAFSTIGGGPGAVRFKENGDLDYRFGTAGYARYPSQGSITTSIDIIGDRIWVSAFHPSGAGTITTLDFFPGPSASRDYDGDGNSDIAVFRPSTGTWYITRSSDSQVQIVSFGGVGDVPIDGDFDGDGKSDPAIYRPSVGQWWILKSSDGTNFAATFGTSTDKPVAADYDKDGKTDIAIWRPSNGNYFVLRSSENFASFYGFPFGTSGDIPVGSAIAP